MAHRKAKGKEKTLITNRVIKISTHAKHETMAGGCGQGPAQSAQAAVCRQATGIVPGSEAWPRGS